MGTAPRRLSQREGEIEREQPLRDVVGLAREGADEVAQGPLHEQQERQRQHEPGGQRRRAIEAGAQGEAGVLQAR